MTGALALSLLLGATAPAAAAPGDANKLMILVPAAGCDASALRPALAAAGAALARDRRSRRVTIDWPTDPHRNLDLLGNSSAFVAALEATAAPAALPALARNALRRIGAACPANGYLVHERRYLTVPRAWRLGQPSPFTKTLVTLLRKPGLTPAEFDREWSGPHATLSLGWRKARGGPGHYAQNPVLQAVGAATPALDGIGEAEGPATAPPSPDERAARLRTAAHARTFQDMDRSSMFVARETVLKDDPAISR